MGSLKYEIAQHCNDMEKKKRNAKEKGPMAEQSARQYKHHAVKYGEWCREHYGCRHFADCRDHIQAYADHLHWRGLSASTVHTYLAGVCWAFDVPLDQIQKEKRVVAQNIRSRGVKEVDSRMDAQPAVSPRLWIFAGMVGCRRCEYQRLRGDDLVTDESGYPCVRIRRGKGGKYQEQRIHPAELDAVKQYFDGSDNYVFSKNEMNNKLDLHALRAQCAQKQYRYYLTRLREEPAYRQQLHREILARWDRFHARKCDPRQLTGVYRLRGANRALAMAHGLPLQYDRLAVMAVSIFHLAHWRCDVTIANYLLAVGGERTAVPASTESKGTC